jgi:DNA ligase-1
MALKIPFETYLFDILYVDGATMIDDPFKERRRKLGEIIKPISRKFELARQVTTDDPVEAEDFYQEALNMGHEGIMIKNPGAPYIPGMRVGHMYKIKPVMETLDLVITGALWGTGKRAGWLSSYVLSTWDGEAGKFLYIGRVGTGVTEEQLEEFTLKLKPLIEIETGMIVKLKPELVVEVAFQEIQKSSKYDSGYALRFPRIVRVREDKSPLEADDMGRVTTLYELQQSSR